VKYHKWLVRNDEQRREFVTRPMKSRRTVRKAYPDDKYTILKRVTK